MRVLLVFIAFFITACVPTPTAEIRVQAEPSPTQESVPLSLTSTKIPPTQTQISNPTPTVIPTETPIPCDAYESFCVDDGHFWLSPPFSGEYKREIEVAYRYGSTLKGKRDPHHGVEFMNAYGSPVLAAAQGRVVYAAEDKPAIYTPWERFYGNLVVIQHTFPELGEPLYTLYAHLSIIDVAKGEIVESGQKIGEVGMTGRAIGSHLHFEVRVGGYEYTDTRNPELWLNLLDENWGAVVVQIADKKGKPIRVPLMLNQVDGEGSVLRKLPSLEAYAAETYPVGIEDIWAESHAIANLPAGKYRLSFSFEGKYWERFVEVYPNKVTVVYFVVEN